MTTELDPFSGPFSKEVPLTRAPLVSVLSQIRFVDILKIDDENFIADFQEVLRDDYPDFKREHTSSILIGPSGPQKVEQGQVWRFANLEQTWRISLEHNFVALETTKYESRSDFMERLERVIKAVADCFRPAFARRIGIRYVDRIEGPEFNRVNELVRDEMVGIARPYLHDNIAQSMSHAIFNAKEGKLNARWGIVPAGETHDPNIVASVSGKSWLLDIDAFREFSDERLSFEAEPLTEIAHNLAARAYTFFNWSVTPEFLKTYGGQS